MIESGNGTIAGDINPKALNPTKEASFGIAQWNPSKKAGERLKLLKDFARNGHPLGIQGDYQDLYVQLSWVVEELINNKFHGNDCIWNNGN
jgi:hypothetical protein